MITHYFACDHVQYLIQQNGANIEASIHDKTDDKQMHCSLFCNLATAALMKKSVDELFSSLWQYDSNRFVANILREIRFSKEVILNFGYEYN